MHYNTHEYVQNVLKVETVKTLFTTSVSSAEGFLSSAPNEIVVDTETYLNNPRLPNSKLLGVSLAYRSEATGRTLAAYIPLYEYNTVTKIFTPVIDRAGLEDLLRHELGKRELIGQNTEYDRDWLDHRLGMKTKWKADTRKMWQMSDSEDLPHGYGLKIAQTNILGWPENNAKKLEEAVKAAGGSLSNGDHYLAPTHILAQYAILDAISTLFIFEHFKPFFDRFDYWGFLKWRLDYHQILTEATNDGIEVDSALLFEAKEELVLKREGAREQILQICAPQIRLLERRWAELKAKGYKRDVTREAYLKDQTKWAKFNPNSSYHRSELFHDVLKLPVAGKTPSGRPKSDRTSIANLIHPASKAFVAFSEAESVQKLATSYAESLRINPLSGQVRIHFPYNNAATVSDRLGGYKPYCLNMPFSEEKLMSAFKLPEDEIGVHADLSAVEPCFIAAFSEDPTLLKVHRDGKGDVYLDFALVAFPDDPRLKIYDPNVPTPSAVKSALKDIRDICKICHLAIGYTGTESTVFASVNKAGFKISRGKARVLVHNYWLLFDAVRQLDYKLRSLHARQGYIRNAFGRVLQVPENLTKDILNRFIQSSGHDALTAWVHGINERAKANPHWGLKPVLPDIHDSTSWRVKKEFYADARQAFEDSLRDVNSGLNLPVTLRAEVKSFRTFAGLKGDEK